ncbi:MAG: aspartate dehydrogenase [Candidatus Bathyarchaeia archaeon]
MIEVGLLGCGTIGTILARTLDRNEVENARLRMVYDLYPEKAEKLANELKSKPRVARSFEELLNDREVKLILEASSQAALREIAVKALESGKDLMPMSVGAFVDPKLLTEVYKALAKGGGRLWIPSGAICGLDGVKAAVVGHVDSVTLTTTKPPMGFAGAPGVEEKKIDLRQIQEPTELFKGPAREACRLFPANVNVAAALSLVGIGPDRTMVRIVADPNVSRNIHEIEVRGDFGVLRMRAENVPSPDNPKTSYLAILSAVATLKKLASQAQFGT